MSRLDDPARLAALEKVAAGAAATTDDRLERVVRLAQEIFGVPMAAVNLVDDHQHVSLAQVGFGSDVCSLDESLCAITVQKGAPLILPDASADPQLHDHAAVAGDLAIRFYAGQPLHALGEVVGTLCLLGHSPRELTESESRILADLASWVEQGLDVDHDRRQALEVQRRLLPKAAGTVPGLSVAGHCQPARMVGGDFYDWQVVGDRLQVVVADVMGKGLTAAVIAAGVRALLRGTSPHNDLASSVARAATDSQEDLDESNTFVTMFAARVDPRSGQVEFVDAGHGLALVLQPDGVVRRLRAGGLPLGALPGDRWETGVDTLAVGETLLVVSDGVLDAFNDSVGALDGARLLAAEQLDPEAVVARVVEHAAQVAEDDVTVVALRREPR